MKHKNITLLTWFNFFSDLIFYGPIAILYFSQITGSYALGLSIFSVQSISAAIFEVPTGILSDFVGRRESMIFGSAAVLLGMLCFALAQGSLFLVLGSAFIGIAQTFFSGNNDALLYDTLKEANHEKKYSEYLGLVSSMSQVGLAAGALIGGFVAGWSFRFVFWISIVPQVICLILSFFVIEPKKHYKKVDTNIFSHIGESIKQFKNNWKLRNLSLSSIIKHGIGESMHQFGPAFIALLWPVWALGIPRFLSHLLATFGFRFAGKIIKKLGSIKTVALSSSSSWVVGMMAYIFPTVISPILLSLTSFNFGTRTVAQNDLLQNEFTDHQRATMGSLNSLFGSLFFALFAFLLGSVADQWGVVKTLVFAEALILLPLLIDWRIFRKMKEA